MGSPYVWDIRLISGRYFYFMVAADKPKISRGLTFFYLISWRLVYLSTSFLSPPRINKRKERDRHA